MIQFSKNHLCYKTIDSEKNEKAALFKTAFF